MTELLIYGTVFLAAFAGVKIFRRWSLKRQLFDVPNERSSHTVPTPRGGGLIIAAVCLAAYSCSAIFLKGNFRWSYLLGALLVALVSWLDDLYTISSLWRFSIHTGTALLAILTLGYFDGIYIPATGTLYLGISGAVLTFFWIVWMTNAYNFMDGIDGIAGMQAVTAGIGWFLIGTILGVPSTGFYGGIIAAAGFGFLIQNWQPAKIFMGDVGSAFLGYSFAVLPLLAKSEANIGQPENREMISTVFKFPGTSAFFTLALILIWLFAFDTLWTFGRRVLNGEKVWEAHRGHIYQRFVIRGFSHRAVSGLYGAVSSINVLMVILLLKYAEKYANLEIILPAFIFIQSAGLVIASYLAEKKVRIKK